MLEFTMSRVTLCICGAIVLGAIAVPLTGIYSEREDSAMEEGTDSVAGLLDTFFFSEADTLTLRGWEILPGSDYALKADGHVVTISNGSREYRSLTECECDGITLKYREAVKIIRTESGTLAVL